MSGKNPLEKKPKVRTMPKQDLDALKAQEKKQNEVVIPKVRLFSHQILLTAKVQFMSESGIILKDKTNNILPRQIVVAAGPNASVEVGDEVEIDPERFQKKRSNPAHDIGPDNVSIVVPMEHIDGIAYLFMTTNELKWVYEKEETKK